MVPGLVKYPSPLIFQLKQESVEKPPHPLVYGLSVKSKEINLLFLNNCIFFLKDIEGIYLVHCLNEKIKFFITVIVSVNYSINQRHTAFCRSKFQT